MLLSLLPVALHIPRWKSAGCDRVDSWCPFPVRVSLHRRSRKRTTPLQPAKVSWESLAPVLPQQMEVPRSTLSSRTCSQVGRRAGALRRTGSSLSAAAWSLPTSQSRMPWPRARSLQVGGSGCGYGADHVDDLVAGDRTVLGATGPG